MSEFELELLKNIYYASLQLSMQMLENEFLLKVIDENEKTDDSAILRTESLEDTWSNLTAAHRAYKEFIK